MYREERRPFPCVEKESLFSLYRGETLSHLDLEKKHSRLPLLYNEERHPFPCIETESLSSLQRGETQTHLYSEGVYILYIEKESLSSLPRVETLSPLYRRSISLLCIEKRHSLRSMEKESLSSLYRGEPLSSLAKNNKHQQHKIHQKTKKEETRGNGKRRQTEEERNH